MNKNKGIIGIGLILAIVLGIVVVGGGAYYLGKSGSQQEVKVEENQILKENQNQSDSIPSIAVLSPNGGESYKVGDTMNIKWTGCNSDQNMSIYLTSPELKSPVTELSIVRNIKCSNNSYGYKIPSSVYGYGISTTLNGNKYKVVVSNGMNGGYGGIDSSDNYFTINSAKTISTTDWKVYRNNQYGFELKYPSDWEFSTYFSNADGFFFSKNDSKIILLPRGGFDHGYEGELIISDIKIDGKQVKKREWNNYTFYQFIDNAIPSTWIECGIDLKNCNRIEIQGSDQLDLGLIDQILSTFKFID